MFKIMLALHLLAAIFAIGPLVGAATTAARSLRTGDPEGAAGSARTLKIYSYASVVVIIFGFGLMSSTAPWQKSGQHVADFGDLWIWLSALLWVVAVALTLGVISPSLEGASNTLKEGGTVDAFKARVAAGGGIVGLIFAAIVFLMVYQPGS